MPDYRLPATRVQYDDAKTVLDRGRRGIMKLKTGFSCDCVAHDDVESFSMKVWPDADGFAECECERGCATETLSRTLSELVASQSRPRRKPRGSESRPLRFRETKVINEFGEEEFVFERVPEDEAEPIDGPAACVVEQPAIEPAPFDADPEPEERDEERGTVETASVESRHLTNPEDDSQDDSMGIGDDSMGKGDDSLGIGRFVDQTRARAGALGISLDPDSLHEAFECPLPGHDHEAALVWTGKFWQVRCGETRKVYGLTEVRAAAGYGDLRRLSQTEANRWHERLDYEAGLLKPVSVPVEVPEDLSDAAERLARGQVLYLGLRGAGRGGLPPTAPYTFAREFAMAWCGLTNDQVKHGTKELRAAGFMQPTGQKIGRALVFEFYSATIELREAA